MDIETLKKQLSEEGNEDGLKHLEAFEYYVKKGEEANRERNLTCEYCGLNANDAPHIPFHIDHIVPRALGGTEHPENLANACAPCNLRKRDQRGWKTRDGRVGKSTIMTYKDGKWRMNPVKDRPKVS